MGYRVFIQIPDIALLRSLREQLSAQGHDLSEEAASAELLLLDADDDSAECCADWRRQGFAQPILLLGMEPAAARVAGADSGIAKPFRFSDLLRAIEQVAAREAIAVGRFR